VIEERDGYRSRQSRQLREPYGSGIDLQGSSAFRAEVRRMLQEMRVTKTGRTLLARLDKAHAARGHVTVVLSWVFEYEPDPFTASLPYGYGPIRSHREPNTRRVIVDEPGPGSSSIIYWDSRLDTNVEFSPGYGRMMPSKHLEDCTPRWVCLAHELIHALHMMEGVALTDFKETDPLTGDDNAEEFSTIGMGPYRDDPLTENAFHAELGSVSRWSHARTCYLKRWKKRR
jgi:hypothetical protein